MRDSEDAPLLSIHTLDAPEGLAGSASSFTDYLSMLHAELRLNGAGALADYIPELIRADPDSFGISIVTTAGTSYDVGDSHREFTIQSVSKVFAYGLALQDAGHEQVFERIGVEPTGDPYNSIIRLDRDSHRPHNPMVNSGAIATAGLIAGEDAAARLNRLLDTLGTYAGRRPGVDMATYASEKSHGHRNRALAHLLLNFKMIDSNIEEILDLYFQQCSILVHAHDLAMMGATLANGGVNPVSRERAVNSEIVQDLLSIMYMCGMYDYSGQWAHDVGLPAKSGVGGGICVVAPGKMGIGIYSPLLDTKGHPVRGIAACAALSRDLGLHVFSTGGGGRLTELLPELG